MQKKAQCYMLADSEGKTQENSRAPGLVSKSLDWNSKIKDFERQGGNETAYLMCFSIQKGESHSKQFKDRFSIDI